MKFGDQVVYSEGGKDFFATVLAVREVDHHLGSDGEPLLHLGFIKEVAGVNVVGTVREGELLQVRHDVVHESHSAPDPEEFPKEHLNFKTRYGSSTYPGGRWREIPSASTFTGTQRVEK